jgi:hypothetical protein
MNVSITIVFGLVLVGFVLSVIFSDSKKPMEDDTKRKQLNEWQDRDILEE